MKKSLTNAVWRRSREVADWATVGVSRFARLPKAVPFDGEPRVALLSVSFNTRQLTKLMLLSLADQPFAKSLHRVVLVDNRSSDGSPLLLEALASRGAILFASNPGATSHGVGLRYAISCLESEEATLPPSRQTNVLLIVDTDIAFLRTDTLPLCLDAMRRTDAALLGELQFDLGEPYAHPCCLFIRYDAYRDARVWPFIDHGAPALWLQRSLRCARHKVVDFPLRSENHILHRGRGSIAAVNRLGLNHAYATVRDVAHFHGNPDGPALWQNVEARHAARLGDDNDDAAVEYIAAALAGAPR